mgnify:CR=1 FL=1
MKPESSAFHFVCHQQVHTLKNLIHLLDKAAPYADTKKFDYSVLLQARLAPDMFPLMRQIQITCDTAKFNAARLSGKTAPSHPDEEKTLADAKARIQSVISYLEGFQAADFEGFQERKVTNARWDGKWMTGADYLMQYAIPNFFFHTATAYNILRHNGVEIGKKDYLGTLSLRS